MCRLLIGTSKTINTYHRLNNLGHLLSHLERECGGHGNGVSLHRGGKLIETHKGIDLRTQEITKLLVHCGKIYDVAIFHTRIASVSGISDANCHPFLSGDDVLAMNGTLSEFQGVANALGVTDTELVFNMVRGLPLDKTVAALSTLDAVFVGMAEGKPYALRNNGALKEWHPKRLPEKDFLFASSFPKGTPCVVDIPHEFVFSNGKRSDNAASYSRYKTHRSPNMYRNLTFLSDDAQRAYDEGYDDGYAVGFEDGYLENNNNLES